MSIVTVRQSQIISTYGPGSLVDLPEQAIIVAGLEFWQGKTELVSEPRLLANLRRRLDLPTIDLRSPPAPEQDDQTGMGIVGFIFPEWFLAQLEVSTREYGRSRPLIHRRSLVKGRYQADDPTGKRKRRDWPVVPVRFVQGCPNGHVSDIDWPRLIHHGEPCGGQLWLDERGTTGDLAELWVRCDGCDRPFVPLVRLQSTSEEKSVLGECRGDRPWLGPAAAEKCVAQDGLPHRNRLLIRHASNAYFPVVERAISIPDSDEALRKAVDALWDDFLYIAESVADVAHERRKAKVQATLEGFTDDAVWAECQRRLGGTIAPDKTLKEVELDTFLSVPDELGADQPEGDFWARRLKLAPDREEPLATIDRIVLVHRLREVVAEVGFTRLESAATPVESEVDLNVRLASLALEPKWLPAVENRGEGVFLSFHSHAVEQWLARDAVEMRAEEFLLGVRETSDKPTAVNRERVLRIYMPYILLHSLSHLLLTSVALECGYATASIRERIYVSEGAYGLLLYTGTPDAEGTLGGLVQIGRRIERHLETALELGFVTE